MTKPFKNPLLRPSFAPLDLEDCETAELFNPAGFSVEVMTPDTTDGEQSFVRATV